MKYATILSGLLRIEARDPDSEQSVDCQFRNL